MQSDKIEFLSFFNNKLKIFLELLELKNIQEININVNALKLIYKINLLSIFIKSHLVPLKDQIKARNQEVFEIIMPKK